MIIFSLISLSMNSDQGFTDQLSELTEWSVFISQPQASEINIANGNAALGLGRD